MRLIIEATGTIERVHGMPARVWKGKTESGIEVTCWIPIVQVRRDADSSQFEKELKEIEVLLDDGLAEAIRELMLPGESFADAIDRLAASRH
ncbi:hypothetical protein NB311A_06653 [Nitrobacter sp. Nb-311A]|uniref:hypothetical protein n=1 Tax=unclassified Nitrobacter TaxID=2620411 RepID=UPI000068716C|nr:MULTISPECIES: hypothetical protein [unclassified Nitrobacter]EAQ34058.1 hypothetical protein NB311A_06653 [Nitrobacter sp. Nb-311A]MCB1393886.1 hypothetical protein [Nitrobacter sp.]MCV0388002.1 hypothetical protein [Nitrobacter sp.]